jgi:hypothetical protein
MNALEDKYKSYVSSECSRSKNIVNPSRCAAAKDYIQSLQGFSKQTVAYSQQQYSTLAPKSLTDDPYMDDASGYPTVWPRANHDFDMRMYATLQYNPYKQGITNQPTISNLVQSPIHMMGYMDAMTTTPLLSSGTQAGISDVLPEDKKMRAWADSKRAKDKSLPYPSFRQDYPECQYPTSGEHAASYFVKTGMIPASPQTQQDCVQQGFQWQPQQWNTGAMSNFVKLSSSSSPATSPTTSPGGTCYKPQYKYVNAQLVQGAGLLPSMFYDLENIATSMLP